MQDKLIEENDALKSKLASQTRIVKEKEKEKEAELIDSSLVK